MIGVGCYVLILMQALRHHMEEQQTMRRDSAEQRMSNLRLMEALRAKRTMAFTDVIGVNVDMTCVVCLVEFQEQEAIIELECHESHIYHKACLDEWILRGNRECPVCRAPI